MGCYYIVLTHKNPFWKSFAFFVQIKAFKNFKMMVKKFAIKQKNSAMESLKILTCLQFFCIAQNFENNLLVKRNYWFKIDLETPKTILTNLVI